MKKGVIVKYMNNELMYWLFDNIYFWLDYIIILWGGGEYIYIYVRYICVKFLVFYCKYQGLRF